MSKGGDDFDDLLAFFSGEGITLDIPMREDVRDIKRGIEDIKRKGFYQSKRDAWQLRELEIMLRDIQDKCQHFWETVTLFNHVRQFCTKCDLENKHYKHVK